MNRGVLLAIGAYGLWGFLPIYWKMIDIVPAAQILSHRIIWSFVFLTIILLIKKDISAFRLAIQPRKTLAIFSLAATLIGVNWLTYIWGVNAGYIVETSLGYFINPLVSVLLGVLFLKEKLRPLQWIPIFLAATGVLYLTISYGGLPWIALVLAFTFGLYGLIKKTAPLNSLHGLTLETGILFLPALFFLLLAEGQGTGLIGHTGWVVSLLLIFTGIVTALPLLLFSSAAKQINLSTLGILQYIAPTMQFLIGVLMYGEPFTQSRLIGFSIIWVALLIYSLEGILEKYRSTQISMA
jgi:chloramphenicol-sensitive protein RarD